MKSGQAKTIHKKLLEWYADNKRVLPWRKNKDPYRIWISEIMLQQTRVEAVIPYYERFLKRFPSVEALAAAPLDDVLALWTGLGYYSRAKNLHKAAQQIVSDHKRFPQEPDALRSLSGIGVYTAHAIASIAFNAKVPAIDGNLERVLARLMDLRENPKKEGRGAIESFGQSLVDHGDAGTVNQAIMDLSSMVCAPKNPRCLLCPLQQQCASQAEGSMDIVPLRVKKEKPEELNAYALLVLHRKKEQTFLLLARRKTGTWLSGLWDIPWTLEPTEAGWKAPTTWKHHGRSLQKRGITKYKIQFKTEIFESPSQKLPPTALQELAGSEWRWQEIGDLKQVNLPRPSHKALAAALAKLRSVT